MNPLGIFAVILALMLLWPLVVALRTGEFRFRSGRATRLLKRSDNPGMFWVVVAFFTGLVLYTASFVFVE